ncbi:Cytochrome c oxidase assembly protein COX19-like protein [Leptotrombidium deliense]|uniref:Cytochrome c oxidase assembly protein COX19-like protein n=1 Tax=Leptotrombidium deliense TaxID=299467 RepID=A0A443SK23_9ACAR|nr:Cytochrome c oxidase assembly protein COX19-like protein [Leptotrombidium deliense]
MFIPRPPDKGSFPLDHENECKKSMIDYLECLRSCSLNTSECREQAKEYLQCRMDKQLMAKEEWNFIETVNKEISSLIREDSLLNVLPIDATTDELKETIALHTGKSMKLFVRREDGPAYEVIVEQSSTVLDLKKAITKKCNLVQQREVFVLFTSNVNSFCDDSKEKRILPEGTHPNTPLGRMDRQPPKNKDAKQQSAEEVNNPFAPFEDGVNPNTGEVGGPTGPEPTRYGDWERKGRVTDF